MSNLFSSFIIQPVVRQARRLSGIPLTSSDNDAGESRQSHVHHMSDGQDVTTENGDSSTPSSQNTRPERSSFLGRLVSSPSAPIARSGLEEQSTAEHVQYTESPATELPPFSEPIPEDDMSYNPSFGIPEGFRSMDTLSSAHSGRSRTSPVGGRSRRSTGRGTARSNGDALNPAHMSGSLPADDGMRLLRQKIHEIRDMPVSNEEKARRMHFLMTEEYQASQAHILPPQSPSSILSQDRPLTPSSSPPMVDVNMRPASPVSLSSTADTKNGYNLSDADAQPTHRPRPTREAGIENSGSEDTESDEPALGCKHYKRNVKIQCFDCRRWYTCRNCHDEAESHHLNRRKTQNMLCMICATPQPAGEYCKQCGQRAAWYYCNICKLWDDDSRKRIYHCDECGICRRGEGLGKDYVHCKRCNVCISIQFATTHRCIERATECDCPICGEYMFTSSAYVAAMPCGHYMHKACYGQYMNTAYKCPICKKSAVNMELEWRKLDRAIESQPMPAQFADTRAVIHCNDCSTKSSVRYHWLGNKCGTCDSYNTNEVQLVGGSGFEQDPRRDARPDSVALDTRPVEVRNPQVGEYRSAGSYFLDVGERAIDNARPTSSGSPALGQRFSPYEVLQRVSRSLSPMRNYLRASEGEGVGEGQGDDDAEMTDAGPSDAEDGDVDFWGTDGRFLSGEEDEAEGDEDEGEDSGDSDESMEDEDFGEEDDADDGDELDGLELFGHR